MLVQEDRAMLYPFFALAAQSPTRQRTFRRGAVAHVLVVAAAAWAVFRDGPPRSAATFGHLLLVAGIVEGAALVGWRLTQMPKSRALEFLLASPLRPARVFVAEALVGLTHLALVTLAGLPVLLVLSATGRIDRLDPLPLTLMPLTWGAVTGLGLAMWAYEPLLVRALGEKVAMGLVLLYLIVGVLAGENLKAWLDRVPEEVRVAILRGFAAIHTHNPFGILAYWLENETRFAWPRVAGGELAGAALAGVFLWRGARRLHAHFHEYHYLPARDVSRDRRPAVGERPLSWWAVKRVSRYSGRINLWLAGGFGVLYAAYQVLGANWPAWMGQRVFQLCDEYGGVAALTTGLVLLAAVPAAFQYGLWDSNAQDRCKRLELLLLTELQASDYWDAAAAAAWRRGRGYFAVALLLWVAAALGGKVAPLFVVAAAAAGVLLWGLYFALGFRAFSRGHQANGLGMLLTVGLPLAAFGLHRANWPLLGDLLPPGAIYSAATASLSWAWLLGPALIAAAALVIARRSLGRCDAELRRWYDRHSGRKVMS
jgi:hypothetical protein